MTIDINENTLKKCIQSLEKRLLESRTPQGFWQGRLSSSALSTAIAVFALAMVDEKKHQTQIHRGLKWLRDNSNTDGGCPLIKRVSYRFVHSKQVLSRISQVNP